MSLKKKIWKVYTADRIKEEELAKKLNISKYIAHLLLCRGIDSIETAEKFLNPSMNDMHDPFLFDGMDKAVERINQAIEKEEHILIYGDYDVDGITGVSLLYSFYKNYGAKIDYYIPKRLDEGYGLNIEAIEKASKNDIKLIITVDCGIGAVAEVARASELGIDVIITDHHEQAEEVPQCISVIDPKLKTTKYPFSSLAGVGVGFKLCQAFWKYKGNYSEKVDPNQYLDMVALGTIADVVPLLDENRVIVKYGLEKINQRLRSGINALIEVCGLKDRQITTGNISFVIAPKINAAGRLGDPSVGVELLLSFDLTVAMDLALKLSEENTRRQQIESVILKEAVIPLKEMNPAEVKSIVLDSYNWHTGVIGIAASKITELTYRPTVLIALENGVGKGSARSIPGFNLHAALMQCSDLLLSFGGHEQAAGLSIKEENIPEFRERLNYITGQMLDEEDFKAKLKIDRQLKMDDITDELLEELSLLEPYGLANPTPVFATRGLTVVSHRYVGVESNHLKLKLESKGRLMDAIGFRMGAKNSGVVNTLFDTGKLDVAYSLEFNTWGRNRTIEMNLKDIRACNGDVEEDMLL